MRRALEIDETSFGPDHPNVAIRLNNLAALLQATNRLAEAEPLLRRALAIFETSLGSDHPSTRIVASKLAALSAERARETTDIATPPPSGAIAGNGSDAASHPTRASPKPSLLARLFGRKT